jgi:hypothetical protein
MLRQMFWSMCGSTAATGGGGATQLVSLTGLLSYYKMDGSYGRAIDVASGYDGSLYNILQGQTGKIGNSYTFAGTNPSSYIDVSRGIGRFDFGNASDFSLCAWVKTSNVLEQMVISKYGVGVSPGFMLEVEGSTAYAVIRDGTGSGTAEAVLVQSSPSLINVTNNNWHYLVATFNRDVSLVLYIDARKAGDASISGILDTINNTKSLMIGRRDNTTPFFFVGNIDEVAIWGRELNPVEVSTLYNNGKGLSYPFMSDSSIGT